jgi:hypothetical protein
MKIQTQYRYRYLPTYTSNEPDEVHLESRYIEYKYANSSIFQVDSRWTPDGYWSPAGVHLNSVGECKVLAKLCIFRAGFLTSLSACSIVKKFKKTGSTENRPRTGCPPKLTEADKQHITQTARKQCRTPFGEIGNQLGLDVSDTTIRHFLHDASYHRCVVVFEGPVTRLEKDRDQTGP